MSAPITIIECPRDAWQGLPDLIPSSIKAAYLGTLIDAGFTHIDAVSFVSPAAVPQMADSERVLELLNSPANIEIIGIVVNQKGADRAIATGAVTTLGFPYSISPKFLEQNQRQTLHQALDEIEAIHRMASKAGLGTVAYISMAFGNPYGEQWSIGQVADACDQLAECGIRQISLADTTGVSSPSRIHETLSYALVAHPGIEIGVHLHASRANAPALIGAAYDAGCRRFDSAIGGLGGCPFAQDSLVGNIPTEVLFATLKDCGAELPAIGPLDRIILNSSRIATEANFVP